MSRGKVDPARAVPVNRRADLERDSAQHRDAIYALFRLCPKCVSVSNPSFDANRPESPHNPKTRIHYETRATWRELIRTMGNTAHPNNLLTLLQIFEELQKVVIRVQRGNPFF